MNFKKWMITGLIGGLALSGSLISGTVQAEESTNVTPPYGNQQAQGRMAPYMQVYYHAQLSQVLNLSEDALYEARQSGKSLVEIANEQNVTRETLVNKMVDIRKEALDKAVKDGVITQEQADFMLENMKNRVDTMVEREDFGPNPGQGMRMGQGQGQGGRGMRWNNNQ